MNFNIADYKNLIIIFPVGLGGNHLRNLISLSSMINEPNFNKLITQYQQDTIHMKTAHFSEYKNLHRETLDESKLKTSQGINLLCGHLGEHIWCNDILINLEKKLYLIIEPSKNLASRSHQRLVQFNSGITNSYMYHETCTLYNLENISKLFEIPHHDISVISADILFSPDLNDLFKFLFNEFLLTFSDDEVNNCTDIHKIWWESI